MQPRVGGLLAIASAVAVVRAGPPAYYQIPINFGILDTVTPYLEVDLGTPEQSTQLAFDLVHTDSWAASHNCWSQACALMVFDKYVGTASTSHISDGEIFALTSKPTIPALENDEPINWQNLGLEAQDIIKILDEADEELAPTQWFLETFNIVTYPDYFQSTDTVGNLGFGLQYGAQMDKTPFIYSIAQQGFVTVRNFATYFDVNGNYLFVGDVEDPGVTAFRGNYTAADVPVFIKDGSWNFQMTNLTINGTDTGFNGAAVLNSLEFEIYVPKVVGAAIAELLGATIDATNPDRVQYSVPCNTTLLPDIVLSTLTGDIPIPPDFYVIADIGPLCPLWIYGRDLFMDQLSYRPIIQLGSRFLVSQFVKYDYQNETMSFAPPVVP